MKPIDFSQIFIGIGAVIPDRSVYTVFAHSGHEDHQCTEAIAKQGNLAGAFRESAYCIDSVFDVLYAGISVISRIEAQAVVPVGLGGDVQVDAGLLPPVQVWSDREVALLRQFIAVLANVGVPAEQVLQNNNGGSWQSLPARDIGSKRAVMSFNFDLIFHCVLRTGRRSGPPPVLFESAEAPTHLTLLPWLT